VVLLVNAMEDIQRYVLELVYKISLLQMCAESGHVYLPTTTYPIDNRGHLKICQRCGRNYANQTYS